MKDLTRIIRYTWDLKRYYFLTAFFVVVVSLLNQVTPFLLKFIVDELTQDAARASLAFIAAMIGLIFAKDLLLTVIENVQGYYGDILGAKFNTLLSQRYYDHILKFPLSYYDNEVAGRITSRLERSIATISQLMSAFANNFLGYFLTAGITLVILAWYAWPVALLLALLFPFYIWLTSLSSRDWQARQEPINRDTDINQGRFIEAVNAIRVVKSFVQEVRESRFFARKRRDIEEGTRAQSIVWHKYDIYRRVGLAVVFAAIYAYIIYFTYTGVYSLGDLVLLLQLVTQAQWPLMASSFIIDNLQRAQAGSRDFFDVMETPPSIADTQDATELAVSRGEVTFRDVHFAYDKGEPVLRGVSFTIEPGTKLALVGESGEGKTTISNLLLRFYTLSGGRILIDGQDVSKVTQKSLREHIAVVFQEPALFSGSVRENVAYARPNATDEEIWAAVHAANAEKFVRGLPQGLDTEIGERGVKLSGGQRQRLAIARAILKDAPILILDEATSSLDSKAEHEVQAALDELMKGRTTLIIAHRLSTIARVDKIVGLRGGRVAEEGSPAELAQGEGIYAELLALQNPTEENKQALERYDIAR